MLVFAVESSLSQIDLKDINLQSFQRLTLLQWPVYLLSKFD